MNGGYIYSSWDNMTHFFHWGGGGTTLYGWKNILGTPGSITKNMSIWMQTREIQNMSNGKRWSTSHSFHRDSSLWWCRIFWVPSSENGGTPLWLDGLFHGTSRFNKWMITIGLRKPPLFLCPKRHGIHGGGYPITVSAKASWKISIPRWLLGSHPNTQPTIHFIDDEYQGGMKTWKSGYFAESVKVIYRM